MVNYITIIAVLVLVGTSAAYPRVRTYRQTDEDVPVNDANSLGDSTDAPDVPDAPVTLAPRLASSDDDDVYEVEDNKLGLPSNATSIRAQITDTFSCEGRVYGYYADVDNECQIFHVCLPVVLYAGKTTSYKWSFICPGQTIFNQESFTCTRPEDSIACEEAPQYYRLNDNFGVTTERSGVVVDSRSGLARVDDASEVDASRPEAPVEIDDGSEAEATTPAAQFDDQS